MLHLFLVIVIVVDVTLCSRYEKSMSHSLCQCCHPCQNKSCKHVKVSNHSWMSLYSTYPHGGDAIKSDRSQKAITIGATVSVMIPRDPFYRKPIEILSFHPDPQAEVVLYSENLYHVPLQIQIWSRFCWHECWTNCWHLWFLAPQVFQHLCVLEHGQRKHSVCSSLNPCSRGGGSQPGSFLGTT